MMENRLSAVESRAYLLEVACAFLVFKIHRVPGRGEKADCFTSPSIDSRGRVLSRPKPVNP